MKKIIILLIFAMPILTLYGQTSVNKDFSPHLSFKGVPIDGTLSEYIVKMEQKGFTLYDTVDNNAVLYGDFAGYEDCILLVNEKEDLVYAISVLFPEQNTWSFLSYNYFSLKEMLTEKYGKLSRSIEKFTTDIEPKNDKDKIYQVEIGNCMYMTTFETDKGEITLFITNTNGSNRAVLWYKDKINNNIIKTKNINDL